jgi:hypothetical protein
MNQIVFACKLKKGRRPSQFAIPLEMSQNGALFAAAAGALSLGEIWTKPT